MAEIWSFPAYFVYALSAFLGLLLSFVFLLTGFTKKILPAVATGVVTGVISLILSGISSVKLLNYFLYLPQNVSPNFDFFLIFSIIINFVSVAALLLILGFVVFIFIGYGKGF
jgi:predicted benzoate:H+ symporter BenE